MRGSQLARQWKIIRLLESRKRGLTIAELSDELDCPVRTIYRDLEALQEGVFHCIPKRRTLNSLRQPCLQKPAT